jgi:hypothetical protein
MGGCGYFLSAGSVFFVTAALAVPAIGKHETPLAFMIDVMGNVDLPVENTAWCGEVRGALLALPLGFKREFERDALNVDPERSAAEIRDDLRRLLIEMGIEPVLIEAMVGPRGDAKLLEAPE